MDEATVITGATVGAALLVALYMRNRNRPETPAYGERHVLHNRPMTTGGYSNPATGQTVGSGVIRALISRPLLSLPTPETDPSVPDTPSTPSTPATPNRFVPSGGAGGSGTGGSARVPADPSVKVATYNVLHETSVNQTWNALQKLIGKGADVIGLNEFASKFDPLGAMLKTKGWALYAPKGVNAVAWDNEKYRKVDSGTARLNKRTLIENKANGRVTRQWVERYAAWVLLEDRRTGRKFYEVSAHLISSIEGKGNPHRKRVAREQVQNLAALTRRLSAHRNVPVFVTGDMNLDEDTSRKGILAPLYAMNFRNNWDWLGTKGMGNGTFGRRFIDWLWSRGSVRLMDQRVIEGLPSDHDAVIGTYRWL